ncbi:MAG: hypothetical protein Tp152DCM46671_50 [Prokaryotic dsDNA virus sp.]|nr:MAG: hypothetical protein Tp152DCM46671_50 [Prokaryotic dsDNA virus sp.]|tara:strand:- start:41584 stop:42285 length:702 start_codon:yes stop_codon:yes gene_type:complete
MADSKEYGYYIEGNKVAIVQRDTSFDNDANSRDYGPGSDKFQWKSPLENVNEGIEFQYSYSPEYKETNQSGRVSSNPISYTGGDNATSGKTGTVKFTFNDNFDFEPYIGQYILLINAGRWSGVHKIALQSTTNIVYTETHYPEADISTTINFESGTKYNLHILVLEDESYEIDLPVYLQKSLVYYLKSRLFEDIGDMKMKEYYYREFTRQLEKNNNSKVPGMRMITPGINAIK